MSSSIGARKNRRRNRTSTASLHASDPGKWETLTMRRLIPAALALPLAACASGPVPTYISGNYYMAGDKNCKHVARVTAKGTLLCSNKHGQVVDTRRPLRPSEIQAWQLRKARERAQLQQIVSQTAQWSSELADTAARNVAITANQNYNLSLGGQNSTVTFSRRGNTWIGSNGQAFHVVGDTLVGPGGQTCRVVGSTILCK